MIFKTCLPCFTGLYYHGRETKPSKKKKKRKEMKSHIRYAEKAGKHLSLYSLIGRGRAFNTDSIYNVGWQTNWAMLLIFTVSSCSVLYYTFKLRFIFQNSKGRYFSKCFKNEALTAWNI